MLVRDGVHLIAYADRLAGSLRGLESLLSGPLSGLFTGVHLLPFFEPVDGADAGFDPTDHTKVDPRLGTWRDVAHIAETTEVMVDVIVNHISASSPQFRDYMERGEDSRYRTMFLGLDSVFPHGATADDLLRIYRPRPGLPFTAYTDRGGRSHLLWTTFTSEQIDLDVQSDAAREYHDRVLTRLAEHGVATVRLDAVGYAVKRAGTSCFLVPETFEFVDDLTERAHRLGLEVLVEVHAAQRRQLEIAGRVDWVYDFALPPLVLHALHTGDEKPLAQWLSARPHNAVTVLDTHDGIGVIDVGRDPAEPSDRGLLGENQIAALVESIHRASGGASRLATGSGASNLDVYQVNCTFFDALGADEERYLLARLVQLMLPGVPQVYYVGLLAGRNDVARVADTGVGRDINRHAYTAEEIAAALDTPVVRALGTAIRLRNQSRAFAGEFEWSVPAPGELLLRWEGEHSSVALSAHFGSAGYSLDVVNGGEVRSYRSVGEFAAA